MIFPNKKAQLQNSE